MSCPEPIGFSLKIKNFIAKFVIIGTLNPFPASHKFYPLPFRSASFTQFLLYGPRSDFKEGSVGSGFIVICVHEKILFEVHLNICNRRY